MLKAQVCMGNDALNFDKTKCIPQPGPLVPAPLLIIALIGTVVISWDKKKHPRSRFFSNMISLLGILETVGLVLLVAYTEQYGIKPSYALS